MRSQPRVASGCLHLPVTSQLSWRGSQLSWIEFVNWRGASWVMNHCWSCSVVTPWVGCWVHLCCMVYLQLHDKDGFKLQREMYVPSRIGWYVQCVTFSQIPKFLWCWCFVLTCCVSPLGECQTFLQVRMGHSQLSIKTRRRRECRSEVMRVGGFELDVQEPDSFKPMFNGPGEWDHPVEPEGRKVMKEGRWDHLEFAEVGVQELKSEGIKKGGPEWTHWGCS